jgi:hypothetical protein
MAVRIRVLLIHSLDFRLLFHVQICISINTPSFYLDFCAVTLWDTSGASLLTGEVCRKVMGKFLTTPYICDYEFIVLGGRISISSMTKINLPPPQLQEMLTVNAITVTSCASFPMTIIIVAMVVAAVDDYNDNAVDQNVIKGGMQAQQHSLKKQVQRPR